MMWSYQGSTIHSPEWYLSLYQGCFDCIAAFELGNPLWILVGLVNWKNIRLSWGQAQKQWERLELKSRLLAALKIFMFSEVA